MRRLLPHLLAIVLAACATPLALDSVREAPTQADPAQLAEDVAWLAADAREGRGLGTKGLDASADFLAERLERLGLAAPFTDEKSKQPSYFQPFDVVSGIERGPHTRLQIGERVLAAGVTFEPFSFSDEGELTAPIVFAGYGISAPELGYDDYAGLDVKDKVVLVLEHEPRERDQASPFRSPAALRYREIRYKAINAREHCAKAILIAPDAQQHPGQHPLASALQGSARSASAGILALAVTADAARAMPGDVYSIAGKIDQTLKPASRALDATASLQVELVKQRTTARNVCGQVPGTDPKRKDEVVLVGAHYDHLGYGGESSLSPDQTGQVHHGADDNASGTAAVLAVAQAFAKRPAPRTVQVCLFSGEEAGLLGSTHYVKNPVVPLSRTVAMLNLDMVGRMRDQRLQVFGIGTAKEFDALVRKVGDARFHLVLGGDGYGPSDHTAFYAEGVPVLFFFTGVHEDYHRPSDEPSRINVPGLAQVASYVGDLTRVLATSSSRPTLVRATTTPPSMGRERGGGYGAYFGSIPDFTERTEPGVLLSGVREGSPAQKAGLQKGDVIAQLGGFQIRNLYDMTFALRAHRAGDEIEVVYLRDGKPTTVHATLEERR